MRRGAAMTAAAVVVAVMGACSAPVDDTTDSESASRTGPVAERPDVDPVEALDPADHLSDEVLLDAVEWVLELLETDATGPAVEAVQERFTTEFQEQIDPVTLGMVFAQTRAGGPWTVTQVEAADVGRTAVVAIEGQEPMLVTVVVDEDGLISGMLFQPDTSGEPPALTDWSDLDEALTELGGEASVVVADVATGELLHTSEGTAQGTEAWPSGSVFKLVVLSAVVDAVADTALDWEQELTITPEVTSLPSGILQDREEGARVTVREAAELMISISDNTATDLLIAALGQDRLGALADELDLPERLRPLLTTRQAFQLGWQVEDDLRTRWSAADTAVDRQQLLDDLPAEFDVQARTVTSPRWRDGVGWALGGADVVDVLRHLASQARDEAGEPVRAILAENPGVAMPDGATYQGFKGGSVPGVLAMAFVVETDAAPQGQILVVQIRSDGAIDQLRASTIVQAGLQHLVDSQG